MQSRYYNPKIGRFLNADSLVSTGQGLLGNNMFAYCLNNPVAYSDSRGTDAKVCIAADGTIDEIPWWDHSPGGGGYVRTRVAVLSLIGAGLSYVNPFIRDNYESLPWENIAEQLGGVNGEYLPGATTVGSIYWAYTVLISLIC